jgi:hypothetical protein
VKRRGEEALKDMNEFVGEFAVGLEEGLGKEYGGSDGKGCVVFEVWDGRTRADLDNVDV